MWNHIKFQAQFSLKNDNKIQCRQLQFCLVRLPLIFYARIQLLKTLKKFKLQFDKAVHLVARVYVFCHLVGSFISHKKVLKF